MVNCSSHPRARPLQRLERRSLLERNPGGTAEACPELVEGILRPCVDEGFFVGGGIPNASGTIEWEIKVNLLTSSCAAALIPFAGLLSCTEGNEV